MGRVNVAVGGIAFNSGTDRDGSYFRVHPFGDLTVAGAVRVTNGPGEDFTNVGGQNLTVGGAVAIHNGDGGSFNTLLAGGPCPPGRSPSPAAPARTTTRSRPTTRPSSAASDLRQRRRRQ